MDRGARHVYRVAPGGGAVEQLADAPGQIAGFSLAGNHLACAFQNDAHPAELYRFPLDGGDRTRLTDFNAAWRDELDTAPAEPFFIALKKLGVPAAFVRYPREGHGISEPAHTKDFLDRHIAWFDRHLKGEDGRRET